MNGYGSFSEAYDRIMNDYDYSAAAEYLLALISRFGGKTERLLDLACGSGRLAAELIRRGLDPVCADASEDILSLARQRLPAETLLLCQSMDELDLNDTVDTCLCTLDSINYITSKKELRAAFARLALFTDPDGLFIFDVNTERKFMTELSDRTYTYDLGDLYLVWNSEYDRRTRRADYDIVWFRRDASAWQRCDETQHQRFWREDELRGMLSEYGFVCEGVFDAYTFEPPSDESERLHFVFRRKTA